MTTDSRAYADSEELPLPSFFAIDNDQLRVRYGGRGHRYGSSNCTQTMHVHYPREEVVVFTIDPNEQYSTEYYEGELMRKYYGQD